MPSDSEYNQFRRYVGDFADTPSISNDTIHEYLNDACLELTSDFVSSTGVSAPVTEFDTLVAQYHPEAILRAAINWWWNQASVYSTQLSTTVGTASQNASDKWDRAVQMIDRLEQKYEKIQTLGTDISIGNLSYFSKGTLTRKGGEREESSLNG